MFNREFAGHHFTGTNTASIILDPFTFFQGDADIFHPFSWLQSLLNYSNFITTKTVVQINVYLPEYIGKGKRDFNYYGYIPDQTHVLETPPKFDESQGSDLLQIVKLVASAISKIHTPEEAVQSFMKDKKTEKLFDPKIYEASYLKQKSAELFKCVLGLNANFLVTTNSLILSLNKEFKRHGLIVVSPR